MSNLKLLKCGYHCGIDQKGIMGLNLTKLNAWDNPRIVDVSWMSNLKILDCSWDCGIDQNGIKGLKLYELHTNYNANFNNVDVSIYLRK